MRAHLERAPALALRRRDSLDPCRQVLSRLFDIDKAQPGALSSRQPSAFRDVPHDLTHLSKPRRDLNEISVLSKSYHGRSLNNDNAVIW